jgi:Sec-independent protein translocase protein TatA
MDFLGIGPAELIVILLVIILVIGPKDIGNTAKSLGRFLNRVFKSDEWRTITEASKTIRTLPNRLAREAELEELQEIKDTFEDAKKDLVEAKDEIDESTKALKEGQQEMIQEVKSIDNEMKSWVAPSISEKVANEAKPSPEPEPSEVQNSSTEQKQSDPKSNDE